MNKAFDVLFAHNDNRGFRQKRCALRLSPAMAFSDLQKTQIPLKAMGAAFVANRCKPSQVTVAVYIALVLIPCNTFTRPST